MREAGLSPNRLGYAPALHGGNDIRRLRDRQFADDLQGCRITNDDFISAHVSIRSINIAANLKLPASHHGLTAANVDRLPGNTAGCV